MEGILFLKHFFEEKSFGKEKSCIFAAR